MFLQSFCAVWKIISGWGWRGRGERGGVTLVRATAYGGGTIAVCCVASAETAVDRRVNEADSSLRTVRSRAESTRRHADSCMLNFVPFASYSFAPAG